MSHAGSKLSSAASFWLLPTLLAFLRRRRTFLPPMSRTDDCPVPGYSMIGSQLAMLR